MSSAKSFKGKVVAEEVEVRFAFSGKVAKVNKNPGDSVKPGELLASLDTRFLQLELDRELADYQRIRADFEIFKIKNQDPSDTAKHEKTRKQAYLDSAVKQVEIAKYKMDQANLASPVEGIVLENSGLRPGLFITPGSYGFEILDLETLTLEIEGKWDDVDKFAPGTEMKVKILSLDQELAGKAIQPLPRLKKGNATIRLKLPKSDEIWPGMEGTAEIE